MDIMKKIGAGAIIIVLAMMMGMMFTSISISDMTALISGGNRIGEYRGEALSPQLYNMVRLQCRQRYERMGSVPDYFIDICVEQDLKAFYVLPHIGRALGLSISEDSMEKQIQEEAKDMFEAQKTYADPDDRRPYREIYQQVVSRNPPDVRRQMNQATMAYQALINFPFPGVMAQSMVDATEMKLNLRVVRFDNAELLRVLGKETVTVTEEMILKRFEEEKKKAKEGDKLDLTTRRSLIQSELQNEERQKKLALLKERLAGMKGARLDEIARITGVTPVQVSGVEMAKLKSVPVAGATLDLTSPELLSTLDLATSGKVVGPIQSGENTAYVEVGAVILPPVAPDNKKLVALEQRGGEYLGSSMINLMIKHEAEKGKFQLKQMERER